MPYTLDQLRMFVEVADAGSFTAAARHLGRSQSTVSFAITNLEVDLDLLLFDRSSRQINLTGAGQRLLIEAREILARCATLDHLAQSIGAEVETRLDLVVDVPLDSLLKPLRGFAAEFPHVHLNCRHPALDVPRTVLEAPAACLGVMFGRGALPPTLDFSQLGRLALTHVVAPGHPLAALQEVEYADLHRYRRLSFAHFGELLPSESYLASNLHWQADSDISLLHMVCAGLGWATLPRRVVMGHLQRGELVELRQRAYPHTDWLLSVELVWDRRRALGRAGEWLRQALLRHAVADPA